MPLVNQMKPGPNEECQTTILNDDLNCKRAWNPW